MSQTAILKNGRVISTINFDQITFSITEGYLKSFRYISTGDVYIYVSKSNLKEEDLKTKKSFAGYYNEKQFLRYLSDNSFHISFVENFKFFQNAIENDILEINILDLDENLNPIYKKYTIEYRQNTRYIDDKDKIIIPTNFLPGIFSWSDLCNKFYQTNLSSIFEIKDVSIAKQKAILLALTAITIDKIKTGLYTLLTDYNALVLEQLIFWETEKLFKSPINTNEIDEYYVKILNFYKITYNKKYSIEQESGLKRLFLLIGSMSSSSISTLSLEVRIEILRLFAKQGKLSDNGSYSSEEESIIKIINSFDINNYNHVNILLDALVDETLDTGSKSPPYKQSLFDIFYNNIQDFNPSIKAIGEFTDSKRFNKDNRRRFVNSILGLWTESKYNPYKNLINGQPNYTIFDEKYSYDKSINKFAIINYNSNKKFGIYHDDFNFVFDPWGRGIYWIKENEDSSLTAYNTYHTYQPISLINYPSETDTSIALPNKNGEFQGGIPIFFLKYIDERGDIEDFYKSVGYFIDFVATFSGIGNLAKFRHLRHLSRLGQVLLVIEGVQVTAGIINFLLNFVSNCNSSVFCRKLSTLLTFIEISSLVTDPIAAAKAKKAAREVVEEGIENGWPSGMLDEITENGAVTTPKQKIEELANQDIVEYINNYVSEGKKDLLENIKKENIFNAQVGNIHSLEVYYSNLQIEEVLAFGAGKGLSKEDSMGILFQACRKRSDGYVADLNTLKNRMDILIQVRKRKFPFTFNNLEEFEGYANNIIGTTLDKFGLKKDQVYYTGSSITNKQSIGGGDFDTDWAIEYTKEDMTNLINEMEKRWMEAKKLNIGKEHNKKIKDMKALYAKKGKLHKRYIISIDELADGTKSLSQLDNYLQSFPVSIKTDLTPVMKNVNVGYPRIKYNFN